MATFWGAYNLILLAGDERYVRHWLYFQDTIGLFNEQNPGGHVVDHNINYAFMRTMIIAGVFTAIKRLMVGLMLGRQTFGKILDFCKANLSLLAMNEQVLTDAIISPDILYPAHYGQDLAATMKNMVLIGKIATLAREIENNQDTYLEASSSDVVRKRTNTVSEFLSDEAAAFLGAEETELRKSKATPSAPESATAFMENRKTMLGAKDAASSNDGAPTQEKEENITESEHATIEELLDAWEEPTRARDTEVSHQSTCTRAMATKFDSSLYFMFVSFLFPFLVGAQDYSAQPYAISPGTDIHEEKVPVFVSVWSGTFLYNIGQICHFYIKSSICNSDILLLFIVHPGGHKGEMYRVCPSRL